MSHRPTIHGRTRCLVWSLWTWADSSVANEIWVDGSGRRYPPDTSRLSGWETVPQHRQAAQRFRAGRLVLQDVPVLSELAVFETHDVGGDPRSRATVARKAAMGDGIVSLGEDHVVFVPERVGEAANEIEQAIAARRDMGAMLDVTVRPEPLRGSIAALVEKRVEGLEQEGLVLFRCRGHILFQEETTQPHWFFPLLGPQLVQSAEPVLHMVGLGDFAIPDR